MSRIVFRYARPMHPNWARNIRDQCQAAGVPFFFKQHGEWIAAVFLSDDDPLADRRGERFDDCYVSFDGETTGIHPESVPPSSYRVVRVGKKAAGRLLDGREWNEFPNEEMNRRR